MKALKTLTLIFSLSFAIASCEHSVENKIKAIEVEQKAITDENTQSNNTNSNKITVSGSIIKKEFLDKIGRPHGFDELYFRMSGNDYFIKFCESNVSREDLENYSAEQSIALEVEIREGAWDICRRDLLQVEPQSRIGPYVIIHQIVAPQIRDRSNSKYYFFNDKIYDLKTLEEDEIGTRSPVSFQSSSVYKYRFEKPERLPPRENRADCRSNPNARSMRFEVFKVEDGSVYLEERCLPVGNSSGTHYDLYKIKRKSERVWATTLEHTRVTITDNVHYHEPYLYQLARNQSYLVFTSRHEEIPLTLWVDLKDGSVQSIDRSASGVLWSEDERELEGLFIPQEGKKIHIFWVDRQQDTPLEIGSVGRGSVFDFLTPLKALQYGDKVAIVSYSSLSTGANLWVLDKKTWQVLWQKNMPALVSAHSAYFNHVWLSRFEDSLIVEGEEAGGTYLRILDMHKGDILLERFPMRRDLRLEEDRFSIRIRASDRDREYYTVSLTPERLQVTKRGKIVAETGLASEEVVQETPLTPQQSQQIADFVVRMPLDSLRPSYYPLLEDYNIPLFSRLLRELYLLFAPDSHSEIRYFEFWIQRGQFHKNISTVDVYEKNLGALVRLIRPMLDEPYIPYSNVRGFLPAEAID